MVGPSDSDDRFFALYVCVSEPTILRDDHSFGLNVCV